KDNSKKEKRYVLDMFPYPSGEGVHIGHPRGYIPSDAYCRVLRMKGYNVLHPMGWDAFGLPAEGYAIKNKVHPKKAVQKNVARYKKQLSRLGLSYDWDREINTTDPEYYKWTQWIFLQMFKERLAYESYEPINWCPSCKTGLANEDLEGGRCERCDSEVEQKPIRQWVLKITDYAEELLKDLEELPEWPESVKESQRNWIGKSQGAEIDFALKTKDSEKHNLKVFTTRPDTLYGATYMVVAPEHPVVSDVWPSVENKKEVRDYMNKAKKKTELQRTAEDKKKTGVKIEGISAINPANGEEIPVFVADYVMMPYGTGAIMAVPAHDERDLAFAKAKDLPIRYVVYPKRVDKYTPPVKGKKTVARRTVHVIITDPESGKTLFLKWKKHNWRTFVVGGVEEGEDIEKAARREAEEETGFVDLELKKITPFYVEAHYHAAHKGENRKAYTKAVHFELKSKKQKKISEEEKAKHDIEWLRLEEVSDTLTCAELDIWLDWLKKGDDLAYTGDGVLENSGEFSGLSNEDAKEAIRKKVKGKKKVTYKLKDWVFSRQRYWGEPIPLIHCDNCGVVPVPEKDLPVKLPNVKSYEPTGTGESPLANISSFVNTKCPKCQGKAKRETNTMPQWAGSCWYYLRFLDPRNDKRFIAEKKERYWMPVDMYVGGVEHATRHLIYARFWHKFLYKKGLTSTKEPFKGLRNQGLVLGPDGRKMSKRWGNVISPDDVVEVVGADAMRIYMMFIGPFDGEVVWNPNGPAGAYRFLERIWRLSNKVSSSARSEKDVTTLLHQTIKKVEDDIFSFSFNTAVSSLMILTNRMEKLEKVPKKDFETLVMLLAPLAPHIAEELWHGMGKKRSVHQSGWPQYNEKLMVEDKTKIAIQVNGKTRGEMEVDRDTPEEQVKKEAEKTEAFGKWCQGAVIKRVIYVKNRIINYVLDN
ncbi:MAG: class I tRNA ligase family protein, partial [Candidatus Paceibacterota bacterium]